MPTYEYLCQTCSHRFETRQKMADEPLSLCPECGGHIRRVLFPAGVVFKGSGFYKTDYNKAKTEPVAANGEAKAEGTPAGETKGEGKPAASGTDSTSSSPTTPATGESKASTPVTK